MSERHSRVVVIGSGPAGLTAALYTARAQLETTVITGPLLGGQIATTHEVENFPGFPEGTTGPELVEAMRAQAERFGTEYLYDSVARAELQEGPPFLIETVGGERIRADAVIVTIGANPRTLGIPGEAEYVGHGVSYCATCDGFFFRNKDVLVVGGGDSALEEGLFLTKFATRVRVVHRRDEFRASQILQGRARRHDKIEFLLNKVVTRINSGHDNAVSDVDLQDTQTGEAEKVETDGVFIFVGHIPNNQLYRQDFHLDGEGYLVTDKNMRTNVPGVFAAGEIQDKVFKQVATSVGQGCAAAMQAEKFLAELDTHGWPGRGVEPREFAAEVKAFAPA